MAAPNSTVRCERIKTQRCCCYKENGVCKGDNVKNGGMRLPLGPPGSDSYRRREKLLQQLGTRFDPPGSGTARTKEAMMASKSLRVSLKHFPGNRTTPSKRREGTRTLRHKASLMVKRRQLVKPSRDVYPHSSAAGLRWPHDLLALDGQRLQQPSNAHAPTWPAMEV